jgi:hypothetical protein
MNGGGSAPYDPPPFCCAPALRLEEAMQRCLRGAETAGNDWGTALAAKAAGYKGTKPACAGCCRHYHRVS